MACHRLYRLYLASLMLVMLQIATIGDDILKTAASPERPELLAKIQHRIGDLIFVGMRDGFRVRLTASSSPRFLFGIIQSKHLCCYYT